MDEVKLVQLISMGFDTEVARSALIATNGNLDRAIEHCLTGGAGGASGAGTTGAAAAASSECSSTRARQSRAFVGPTSGGVGSSKILHVSDVSQYTVQNGRSACTCIALRFASNFLSEVRSDAASASVISSSFLSEGVTGGVQLYQRIVDSFCCGNSVEHMSAEEVLNSSVGKDAFASLRLCGGIRQGVLTPDSNGTLGFHALLSGLSTDSSKYSAVLITKSPETVLVIVPPSSKPGQYLLIDSHPRPQLSANGSYVLSHDTIDALGNSLSQIFPFTDIGSDCGDMMQMMYNAFDAYVLQA